MVAAHIRAAGAAILDDTMARVLEMAPGLDASTELGLARGCVAWSRPPATRGSWCLGCETRTGMERLLPGGTTGAVVAGTRAGRGQGVAMVESLLADWRLAAHPQLPDEVRVADERPADALLAASETADVTARSPDRPHRWIEA